MNSQAAKRYACDRCREQKLRCTRTQPGDNTCDRCLRIGAFCVMSSGRPLGRPPLHTHAAQVDRNQSPYPAQRPRKPVRRGIGSLAATPNTNPLPSPPSYSDPASASTASGSDGSGITALFPPPAHFDEMLNMHLDESDFINDASSSAGYGLDTAQNQPFGADSAVPDIDFGNMSDTREAKRHLEGNSARLNETSASHSINTDSLSFLVSVISSISRQLVDLKNRPWESWDPCQMRLSLFHSHEPVGLEPWENSLYVTMRFALVLQTMVPAQFTAAPPPYDPPNLSVTLMLLSTYIQLGELFDTILTRISTWIQETQTRRSPPAHPHPASMQVTMMIQVLEHQLHSLERLMGLPSKCRLWSRKDAYAGILDQEESSVLTQAVMAQAQETFLSLKRTIEVIQISMRGSSSALSLPSSAR
ncbi:hypothetical protein ASPWEDRAFT_177469 [Aspergillus wentii DTO 134E9]|uniref:Zn(2)-C6 fungal-type domain-containing protein n=1 Tax=Aspergillus wentii DTO 134E9 TaxID=1073089 RepID=A0A1L9R4B0_ASPWE|nr:uncharacterized protein ASPWEDRAFT_177469 [Aspergillus wentii DTO 134E9]KAI9927013.1 hypothetical protein MW887_003394 [Aspergillus wentii]OJJ29727.1 hypothetical protein ASPWEDRAFT_177469 [Aspergillus wentii DTO 134E9]